MSKLTDELEADPQEIIEYVCIDCKHDHGWSLSDEPYEPEPGTTPCDVQARFGAGYDVSEMVLDCSGNPVCTQKVVDGE